MEKMELEALVKKYKLSKTHDGRLRVGIFSGRKASPEEEKSMRAEVVPVREEILKHLVEKEEAEKQEFKRRKELIDAIDGLAAIREKRRLAAEWHREFNRHMEDENLSSVMPDKPYPKDLPELEEKYPEAVFVLKVINEQYSSNYEIASIAENAMEKLYNGCSIDEMKAFFNKEKNDFAERHIWD